MLGKKGVAMLSRLFRGLADISSGLEALEGRSLLSADLAIAVGALKEGFGTNNNPTIKVPVRITNVGDTVAPGGGTIEFYLSSDTTFDDSDTRFATMALPKIGGPGRSADITLNTLKPAPLVTAAGRSVPSGDYHILARLVMNLANSDTNAANNVSATSKTTAINYNFGNLSNAKNATITVDMPGGVKASFQLIGPGVGELLNVDGNIVVDITGSTKRSSFFVNPLGKNTGITINTLTINGVIKDLTAPRMNVDGDISMLAVGRLILNNVTNSNFRIGPGGVDTELDLGQVTNTSITSSLPIRLLSVARWRDTDSTPDQVNAPYVTKIGCPGDFEAGVLTSISHKTFGVETVGIGGHVAGVWVVTGNIDLFKVGSIAPTFGGTIRGNLNQVLVARNAGGQLSAINIGKILVGGNVVNAIWLAGADFGGNGVLDGSLGGDSFFAGAVGQVQIQGAMTGSIIGAGLNTTDGTIGNSDDRLEPSSLVRKIIVNHGMSHSAFISATLPSTASINFITIKTANDSRFITGSTVPPA
jgi:hypothetical protein